MRVLHTSDWHLGRRFHKESLLEAQRTFLDHLAATVERERVDAVVVAGDVYDRAVPPLAAIELFDSALHRLAELGVPTVMISGNHDSARRLGVGSGLMERAGIHLRTDPEGCGTPVLLRDGHGDVAFYGLPYLEPALVRGQLGAEGRGHTAVLGAAMDRVRADLAQRHAGTRSVVLAHAFVQGGEGSDSERDITTGGVASVPASVFDGADYVALGHLHGCQTITERVRYSGSPLAFSFSEERHRKSMWLVDLGADGSVDARRLECPVPRPLRRLTGTLEELLEKPEHEEAAAAWVEATLTDPVRPHEPMARLERRFPHVVSIRFRPERTEDDTRVSYAERLRGRNDRQIAEDFTVHVRGGAPGGAALTGADGGGEGTPEAHERRLFAEAFDAVRVEQARETAYTEPSGAGGRSTGPQRGSRGSEEAAR